jgi:acyl-CoA synthetase (AMP-forming)/AMP-acid ligase II
VSEPIESLSLASARIDADTDRRRELWRLPRASTLIEVVRTPAETGGDLAAIFFSSDGRTCTPLTWRRLWQAARVTGQGIRAEAAGGCPAVLLAVPTSAEFFMAFFGILAAGAVPVPVALPGTSNLARLDWYRELVAGVASNAGAQILVTSARFAPVLTACLAAAAPHVRVLTVEALSTVSDMAWQPADPGADDLALLQYTSGSTSQPKGVELTHANIIANASLIADALVTPESAGVSWLPLYHDMGLIGGALTALYSRTPIVLMPATLFIKEPASWLRAIGAFRATITLAPNFAFRHAVRHVAAEQLDGVSLDSLQTALNGAEPVDAAAIAAFEETFAVAGLRSGVVRPVYGLAESSLAVTFADPGPLVVDHVDADALETAGAALPASTGARTARFVSVGRSLPTQELRIVDGRGAALGDRQVGAVVVRGPSVMRGYHDKPAETAAALRDGWLHTGDLGYLADGQLFLTGRARDLIIRHGRNYYPADMEAVVNRLEGLDRGASVAFTVAAGADPQVVVVAETRVRDRDVLARVEREIRTRLHDAFLFGPDDVRLVPIGSIPRTTSGKVRRDACRRLYVAGELDASAPRSENR